MAPRRPKRAPRGGPEGPKTVPRAPKRGPRGAPEGPKTAPRAPKRVPRAPQEGPKRRPRESQRPPTCPQQGPIKAPRELQDAPNLRYSLHFARVAVLGWAGGDSRSVNNFNTPLYLPLTLRSVEYGSTPIGNQPCSRARNHSGRFTNVKYILKYFPT